MPSRPLSMELARAARLLELKASESGTYWPEELINVAAWLRSEAGDLEPRCRKCNRRVPPVGLLDGLCHECDS